MKKKVHLFLNVIMGGLFGAFLGCSLYSWYHYQTYPELYLARSAPWYTGILLQGAVTGAVILLCLLVKAVLWYLSKRK